MKPFLINKKFSASVIQNLQYSFAILAVLAVNIYQYFSNIKNINYLFTDDLWVLAGSQYSTLYEKLICCSISHPLSSLYFQELYSVVGSDQNFLNILFLIGQLLPLSLLFLKYLPISQLQKSIMIIFLISSPMYLNYSIRTKPYVYDALILIFILNLYFKSVKTKRIVLKDFILLSFFTAFSFVSVISIACCFLLISFDFIFKNEKIEFSKIGVLVFSIFPLIIFYLNSAIRDETLNEWWNSYFMPVEGGIYLVLRWLYFSTVSLFSESNPTNFGFSNLPTYFSIPLFFGSLFIVFKGRKKLFSFVVCLFSISLLMSLFKMYPFGGTRTNIYLYGVISMCIAYGASQILKFLTSNELFVMVVFVIFIIFFNLSNNSISYEKTTKLINTNTANLVLSDIKSDDTKLLIHHGSHWFMNLYYPSEVVMEVVTLYPKDKRILGSGGFSTPAPILLDDKFIQICFDFPQTKRVDCTELIDNYFKETTLEYFKFAGFYVEDRDFTDYLEVFTKNNFKINEIYKDENIIYLYVYK